MNDESTSEKTAPLSFADGLAAVLCAGVGLRTLVAHVPQLWWDVDPRSQDAPSVSIGPAGTALVDVLLVSVLAAVLIDRLRRGRSVRWAACVLWLVGAAFAWAHGWRDADSLRIGLSWTGALAAGLAAWHLAACPRRRLLFTATALALVLPMGLQAGYETFVERPETIRYYEAHRDEIARQRGFQEGSHDQRKFEQRMYHFESRGRFEFSNVFASVMMTLALLGAGLSFALWRMAGVPTSLKWAATALTASAAFFVCLTGSKGAVLAGAAAVLSVGTLAWLTRRRSWSAMLWPAGALGAVAVVVSIVIVRGLIGPPETAAGERSLLFRYHYWQGAAGVWAEAPLLGVGPGRFRQAYLMHKNPISPEDVSSPHNVFVTFLSTLGLGGLAFGALIGLWLWCAARGAARAPAAPATPPLDPRSSLALAVGAAALIFVPQYLIEMNRYWLDTAALWLMGAVGFTVFTAFAMRQPNPLAQRSATLGLFAAGLAALLHAQIDMAMTHAMSAPLLFVLLASAAARDEDVSTSIRPAWRGFGCSAAAVTALAAILWATPIVRQQAALAEAARALRQAGVGPAVSGLARAHEILPTDPRPAERLAALLLESARAAHRAGDAAGRDERLEQAFAWLEAARTIGADPAKRWNTLAQAKRFAWQLTGHRRWLQQAVEAAQRALAFEPYSIQGHRFAAELADALGDHARAAELHRRALELSDQAYLDPLKQLTDAQRQAIRRRLEQGPTP